MGDRTECVLFLELKKWTEKLQSKNAAASLESVKAVVEKLWGIDGKVVVTGSYMQGTAIETSDLDLRLQFPARMRVMGEAHFLSQIARYIDSTPTVGMVKKQELYTGVKVPLLKLHHVPSGLIVDITFASESCGTTDAKIRSIVEMNPSVLPVVNFVKFWSQRRDLAGAFSGHLNSVSWVVLVLGICQGLGLLPILDDEAMKSFKVPPSPPSSVDLLHSFFRFLSNMTGGVYVDLKTGTVRDDPAGYIFLTDPGDDSNNLASSARPEKWQLVVSESRRVLNLYDSVQSKLVGPEGFFEEVLEKRENNKYQVPSERGKKLEAKVAGNGHNGDRFEMSRNAWGRSPADTDSKKSSSLSRSKTIKYGNRVALIPTEGGRCKKGKGAKGTVLSVEGDLILVKFDDKKIGELQLPTTSLSLIEDDDSSSISSLGYASSSSAPQHSQQAYYTESSRIPYWQQPAASQSPAYNSFQNRVANPPLSFEEPDEVPIPDYSSSLNYWSPSVAPYGMLQDPLSMMPPDCAISPVQAPIKNF
eukprot:TRINITY_DN1631_c6_g2_i1.p1 TRINITY_DN1631_c6_g2~~TRINITY_DN1631_c6_g2_i1.p1  ORF type:complete len:530 (+),score=108.43 TRINITY_DN1631_c6_g2_i1:71-1660(+)